MDVGMWITWGEFKSTVQQTKAVVPYRSRSPIEWQSPESSVICSSEDTQSS